MAKKTKNLSDFFGILSDKEGEAILRDLKRARKIDMKLEKKRMNKIIGDS